MVMHLLILTLATGLAAEITDIKCTADITCRSFNGISAIDQIQTALYNASFPFSRDLYSTEPIAVYWEYNQSAHDPHVARLWTAAFESGSNHTVSDALGAATWMQNSKCASCATAMFGGSRFVIKAVNISGPSYGSRPAELPSNCLKVSSQKTWQYGYSKASANFCPNNFTSPGCANLTANGCQIGPYLWTTPIKGPAFPGCLGTCSRLLNANINYAKAEINRRLSRDQIQPSNDSFHGQNQSSWWDLNDYTYDNVTPGVYTPTGITSMTLPIADMTVLDAQDGMNFVGANVLGSENLWFAGEILDVRGNRVGNYNFTTDNTVFAFDFAQSQSKTPSP